jgi:hypothetical protein
VWSLTCAPVSQQAPLLDPRITWKKPHDSEGI